MSPSLQIYLTNFLLAIVGIIATLTRRVSLRIACVVLLIAGAVVGFNATRLADKAKDRDDDRYNKLLKKMADLSKRPVDTSGIQILTVTPHSGERKRSAELQVIGGIVPDPATGLVVEIPKINLHVLNVGEGVAHHV